MSYLLEAPPQAETMHRFRCFVTGLDLEVTHVGLLDQLAHSTEMRTTRHLVLVVDLVARRRYSQAAERARRLAQDLDSVAATTERLIDERLDQLGHREVTL